jgi:hypothetical protein
MSDVALGNETLLERLSRLRAQLSPLPEVLVPSRSPSPEFERRVALVHSVANVRFNDARGDPSEPKWALLYASLQTNVSKTHFRGAMKIGVPKKRTYEGRTKVVDTEWFLPSTEQEWEDWVKTKPVEPATHDRSPARLNDPVISVQEKVAQWQANVIKEKPRPRIRRASDIRRELSATSSTNLLVPSTSQTPPIEPIILRDIASKPFGEELIDVCSSRSIVYSISHYGPQYSAFVPAAASTQKRLRSPTPPAPLIPAIRSEDRDSELEAANLLVDEPSSVRFP